MIYRETTKPVGCHSQSRLIVKVLVEVENTEYILQHTFKNSSGVKDKPKYLDLQNSLVLQDDAMAMQLVLECVREGVLYFYSYIRIIVVCHSACVLLNMLANNESPKGHLLYYVYGVVI